MTKNLDISVLLDFYGTMLTEKQRDVVELYYNEDLSLSEIAAHSGITRQGVRDSIKRAEAQLFEYEEKLQLVARFNKIQQSLNEICESAREIYRLNKMFTSDIHINAHAKHIADLCEQISDES